MNDDARRLQEIDGSREDCLRRVRDLYADVTDADRRVNGGRAEVISRCDGRSMMTDALFSELVDKVSHTLTMAAGYVQHKQFTEMTKRYVWEGNGEQFVLEWHCG